MTKSTKCPTCRHVATKAGNKLYPFCCERCHLIDLGRWLAEDYRVPDESPLDEAALAAIETNKDPSR